MSHFYFKVSSTLRCSFKIKFQIILQFCLLDLGFFQEEKNVCFLHTELFLVDYFLLHFKVKGGMGLTSISSAELTPLQISF